MFFSIFLHCYLNSNNLCVIRRNVRKRRINVWVVLIDIANLRLQNPESSLTELLNIYNSNNKKQLTRSGLNHRISKLVELSKQ
jgi:DNA-binding transcriptional regulator WhiA